MRPRAATAGTLLLSVALCGFARCDDPQAFLAPPPPLPAGTWELVWADEFEGPAGQLPDPSRWSFDVGGSGWGNQQLEYDTGDRCENASLDGEGNLAITARKETWQVGAQTWAYTSARINTRGKLEQRYGRIEARIQIPSGQGIWPAFWLLGADFGSVGWPGCGEIDVLEARGQLPQAIYASLHGPGYSGGGAVTTKYYSPDGAGFHEAFHVYAVEWTPSRIAFSVDDVVYRVVQPQQLPAGARWVFDHPFFVILNVAVGGGFVGPPADSTVFPQTMRVDWVRVHEWVPAS
jgi:beta-glucanase (GH16 family)